MLMCGRNQHNIIKQLSSNYKEIKKKKTHNPKALHIQDGAAGCRQGVWDPLLPGTVSLSLGALGTLADLANACLGLIAALVPKAVLQTQKGFRKYFLRQELDQAPWAPGTWSAGHGTSGHSFLSDCQAFAQLGLLQRCSTGLLSPR